MERIVTAQDIECTKLKQSSINNSMNEQQYWNELPQAINVLAEAHTKEFENDPEGLKKWHINHSRNGVWASSLFNDDVIDNLPPSYKNACRFYREKYNVFDLQIFASLSIPGIDVFEVNNMLGLGWHIDEDNVIIAGLYGKTNYKVFSDKCDMLTIKNSETLYMDKETIHKGFSDINPRIILSMGTHNKINKNDVTYHYEDYIQYKPTLEEQYEIDKQHFGLSSFQASYE